MRLARAWPIKARQSVLSTLSAPSRLAAKDRLELRLRRFLEEIVMMSCVLHDLIPEIPPEAATPEEKPRVRPNKGSYTLRASGPGVGTKVSHQSEAHASTSILWEHAHVQELRCEVAIRYCAGETYEFAVVRWQRR
eukprot:TRINITY_DN59359_c0_g1_i1.p2 TRINITY_DN59359_c0_g1~~TRINITY_DN59359_c0_g1_i1.p2  ORF type:complete len:136 (+),score=6.60 TRINITY_DN59359_c0_g1_i1:392-799(+)